MPAAEGEPPSSVGGCEVENDKDRPEKDKEEAEEETAEEAETREELLVLAAPRPRGKAGFRTSTH